MARRDLAFGRQQPPLQPLVELRADSLHAGGVDLVLAQERVRLALALPVRLAEGRSQSMRRLPLLAKGQLLALLQLLQRRLGLGAEQVAQLALRLVRQLRRLPTSHVLGLLLPLVLLAGGFLPQLPILRRKLPQKRQVARRAAVIWHLPLLP